MLPLTGPLGASPLPIAPPVFLLSLRWPLPLETGKVTTGVFGWGQPLGSGHERVSWRTVSRSFFGSMGFSM